MAPAILTAYAAPSAIFAFDQEHSDEPIEDFGLRAAKRNTFGLFNAESAKVAKKSEYIFAIFAASALNRLVVRDPRIVS